MSLTQRDFKMEITVTEEGGSLNYPTPPLNLEGVEMGVQMEI